MRFTFLAVLTSFAIGCSQPAPAPAPSHDDDHDHNHGDGHGHVHDAPLRKADVSMPASFAELVSRVEQCRDQIKAAVDSGEPETAHRAFEELDILLEETMLLAQKSVPEDQLAAVNQARQSIRNAFLEMHQRIDAKENPDYAAKKQAIQTAIATLKQIAAESSTK